MKDILIKKGWKKAKLGSICNLKYGKGLPKRNRKKGKYPVYGSGGIVDFHKDYLIEGPGIIVGRKGSIGNVFFEKSNFFPIDTVFYIEENKEKYDIGFLFYLLKTLNLDKLNSDAAVPGLNRNIAHSQKVEIPPIDIQKKIKTILSVYDNLIENNNYRIKILDEISSTIYNEWFNKLRFPGYKKVKMDDSEFGEIPEKWEVKKLSNICSKVVDGTHDTPKPVNKGYHLVTGKHIVNGFIDFSQCYFISPEEHLKVMKRSKPEKGDTIFSNIGTLGNTTIVDHDFEFSIKNVALFKPLKPIYSYFIYLYFSSPEILGIMERKASGTSQKFFSLKFLRSLDIIMPPDDLILEFNSVIKPILEQRSLLNEKNLILRETHDILLPKLISGEINVENELNIDNIDLDSEGIET